MSVTHENEHDAEVLLSRYPDQAFSYVDAISFSGHAPTGYFRSLLIRPSFQCRRIYSCIFIALVFRLSVLTKTMLNPALTYARDHRDQYLQDLLDLVAIPSVSAQPDHAADVRRAADWLAQHLQAIGLNASMMETAATRLSTPSIWALAQTGRPRFWSTATTMCSPPSHLSCGRASLYARRFVTA